MLKAIDKLESWPSDCHGGGAFRFLSGLPGLASAACPSGVRTTNLIEATRAEG